MLGPYRITGRIGEGGMGAVYRAEDTRLGRAVAIKVLTAVTLSDRERLQRFEQEARATGMLNHPNLLAVFDTGQHEGAPLVLQLGLLDHGDGFAHGLTQDPGKRPRNSMMWAAISGPESSCRKCPPVTRCGPSA